MLEHGYTKKEWRELESFERAMCIAYMRAQMLIEAHHEEAFERYLKRKRAQEKR